MEGPETKNPAMSTEVGAPNDIAAFLRTKAKEDPNKHYRFIRKQQSNVDIRRAQGYSPCEGKEKVEFGDLVLASCPKEMHEARRTALAKKNVDRVKEVSKAFHEKARQSGVLTYENSGEREA